MSTRANIIVKGSFDTLYFYRHSDGYPGGVYETLNKFLELVNKRVLRNNAMQSAGWLILLGANEYNVTINPLKEDPVYWKVGAYEPTTNIYDSIDYLYVIDIEKDPAECYVLEEDFNNWKTTYTTGLTLLEAYKKGVYK